MTDVTTASLTASDGMPVITKDIIERFGFDEHFIHDTGVRVYEWTERAIELAQLIRDSRP